LIFGGICPDTGIFSHCNCPACGMTRGLSRLLRGDIQGALAFNKMVIIVFIVMIVLIVINLIKIIKEYKKTGKIYSVLQK